MKLAYLIALVLLVIPATSTGQKKSDVDPRVSRLEKTIDSLRSQLRFHNMLYQHSEIEISGIRARLALEMNRNFVYFASVFEDDADFKDGKGYQRVFRFHGYHSASHFADQYRNDRAGWLRLVRNHVKSITDIIQGGQTESIQYEEYTTFPHRVVIVFLDNSKADEVLIESDSHLKSLKVRLDGILQDVGWD